MSIDFRRDLIWVLPEKQTLIESQQDDDEILSQAADWLTHLILRTGERKDAMHCTPERCFSGSDAKLVVTSSALMRKESSYSKMMK